MNSKQILSDIFSPILKEKGFKKKGFTWYLMGDEIIGIINIQKSQYSDLCYINIGLCIVENCPPIEFPKFGIEYGYIRYEDLLVKGSSNHYDNILSFEHELSASETHDLSKLLLDYIVPFLKQYSTRSEVIKAIETRDEYWWGGLKNRLKTYHFL